MIEVNLKWWSMSLNRPIDRLVLKFIFHPIKDHAYGFTLTGSSLLVFYGSYKKFRAKFLY